MNTAKKEIVMMTLSRIELASVVIDFFYSEKEESYYALAERTELDIKTIIGWHNGERKAVRKANYLKLIQSLQQDISENYSEFSNFLMSVLENKGISRKKVHFILSSGKEIPVVLDQLLEMDLSNSEHLQDQLGTAGIVRNLKSLCSQYRDFFQVSDQIIGEGESTIAYSSIVYTSKSDKADENNEKELNYVILKFPKAYHVCILLTNYQVDFSNRKSCDYFFYMIEKLKTQNNLKMLILFSDIDQKRIPFSIQSLLMNRHNLFFEFVQKSDLNKVPIHGLELSDEDMINVIKAIDKYRYAQLIFGRLMSYLSVISNEIIFQPYLEKLHKDLDLADKETAERFLNRILPSNNMHSNSRNFTDYSKNILLKDICQYSYLTRHSIYYERTLLSNAVDKVLEEHGKQKIGLAIEVCAPKSLTASSIIDRCEKLLLFTASYNAYSLMSKLEQKTNHKFLPDNVSLRLSHLNPEYMMHQYADELNGKVDLLVIGYGAGSQIEDLIRFLRYAYNWLSEDGIIFLSTYNSEAINMNNQLVKDQRFERIPFNQTDYWIQTVDEQTILLKKSKTYSPEHLLSTVMGLFNTSQASRYTHPYMSALINPDVYSREILDEIRVADKMFAQHGKHGQIVDIIARKNTLSNSSVSQIKSYLDMKGIKYDFYSHTLAPDSHSLKRSLQAKDISLKNTLLLKTVILQAKGQKSANISSWYFAILPYDKKVAYDYTKFELVSESLVLKQFNQGSISPLTVITENDLDNIPSSKIILMNRDMITTKFVIMGGGSNSESIRIKTKDFNNIITKLNIASQSIIE